MTTHTEAYWADPNTLNVDDADTGAALYTVARQSSGLWSAGCALCGDFNEGYADSTDAWSAASHHRKSVH